MINKSILFIATGAHIGYIPIAPGTFGTAVALPICYLLSLAEIVPAGITMIGIVLFAVWIAGKAEKIIQKKDPGCIVIDEIAGLIVTLAWLPFNLFFGITGFLVFRVLDIVKPIPIRSIEKRLTGGVGIVADDVVAGVMANIILRLLAWVMAV